MRDDVVYNKWDNKVMVKTAGEYIYIICHNEEQVEPVMNRMTTDTCFLSDYEEWDEDEKADVEKNLQAGDFGFDTPVL